MNSFGNVIRPLSRFIAVSLAAVVAGCGGGGGNDAAPAAPVAAAAPIGDVSGTWSITESGIIADQPQCEPSGSPGNPLAIYKLNVAQATPKNNAITVTDAANSIPATDFPGTIKGPALSWSGSFPERGGTTTYNSVNLTVGADCNALSGTTNWTYVQDSPAVFSCTGTTTLSGTKDGGATCTPPASPS